MILVRVIEFQIDFHHELTVVLPYPQVYDEHYFDGICTMKEVI